MATQSSGSLAHAQAHPYLNQNQNQVRQVFDGELELRTYEPSGLGRGPHQLRSLSHVLIVIGIVNLLVVLWGGLAGLGLNLGNLVLGDLWSLGSGWGRSGALGGEVDGKVVFFCIQILRRLDCQVDETINLADAGFRGLWAGRSSADDFSVKTGLTRSPAFLPSS